MPNRNINVVYMEIAERLATLSYAERKKVGAIIVKDDTIIGTGYNGTPKGFSNVCEEIGDNFNGHRMEQVSVTKREVLHAESNAIMKCAKSTQSSEGSTLYVTMSPCFECSKLIIQSGIERVFYKEEYRDKEGIELLKSSGINVLKLNTES